MIACMGGWCLSRQKCANYHAPVISTDSIVERLCGEEEEVDSCREVSKRSTVWGSVRELLRWEADAGRLHVVQPVLQRDPDQGMRRNERGGR